MLPFKVIKKEPPILLTSSVIAYDKGVSLLDTKLRIRYALESIEKWLQISPQSPLVLCDGSNFDFENLVKEKFPTATIECLFFENDQNLVKLYGRGYGEGEIVKYAINHSKYINISKCFTKCTSKLWVKNYRDCLIYWNSIFLIKGAFSDTFSVFKKSKFNYVDTRFYISTVDFYKNHLWQAHECLHLKKGYSLEDSFFDIFQKIAAKNYLLPIPSFIFGVGGGIGFRYKNNWIKMMKEKIRFAILSNSNKFDNYFIKLNK